MHQGRVDWFHRKRGYGFILQDDGTRVFVHYTDIIDPDQGFKFFEEGEKVEFNVQETPKGLKAINVMRVKGEAPDESEPDEEEC